MTSFTTIIWQVNDLVHYQMDSIILLYCIFQTTNVSGQLLPAHVMHPSEDGTGTRIHASASGLSMADATTMGITSNQKQDASKCVEDRLVTRVDSKHTMLYCH